MGNETKITGGILAVDDTPGNLRILLETLSAAGHQVLVASDGETAIETASYAKPDLILLDVMMPGISGYATCARLKEDPETASIPVIFMTALQEIDDKLKGFEVGAVDFLTKPFAEAELLARVNTHLSLSRLQTDLARRNSQLEELNRIKNEFLGMAAHDIRNPLTTVLSSTELIESLADRADPDKIRKFTGYIATAAKRINAIITNLLDVNAIESGERHLKPAPVDLAAMVGEILQQSRIRAGDKDITIQLDPVPPAATAHVDKGAAEQVIENIVSNAIKYSPGGTTITVTMAETPTTLRVAIADQGPGLSPEDQAKMFGKFCRLAPRPTGGEPSTGLGLWIVKQLTESMRGTIRCESEVGRGSTFHVEWPRNAAEASEPKATSQAA